MFWVKSVFYNQQNKPYNYDSVQQFSTKKSDQLLSIMERTTPHKQRAEENNP